VKPQLSFHISLGGIEGARLAGAFEIDAIKLLESRISPSLEGAMRGCFLSTKFYCA